jgi:putative transposase
LAGKLQNEFQDVESVLKQFGDKLSGTRYNYREFVRQRIELGNRPEVVGGGLPRSSGGWGVFKAMSKARIHLKRDERILGESEFVKDVLSKQEEKFNRRYWLRAQGYDFEQVVQRVAEVVEI